MGQAGGPPNRAAGFCFGGRGTTGLGTSGSNGLGPMGRGVRRRVWRGLGCPNPGTVRGRASGWRLLGSLVAGGGRRPKLVPWLRRNPAVDRSRAGGGLLDLVGMGGGGRGLGAPGRNLCPGRIEGAVVLRSRSLGSRNVGSVGFPGPLSRQGQGGMARERFVPFGHLGPEEGGPVQGHVGPGPRWGGWGPLGRGSVGPVVGPGRNLCLRKGHPGPMDGRLVPGARAPGAGPGGDGVVAGSVVRA